MNLTVRWRCPACGRYATTTAYPPTHWVFRYDRIQACPGMFLPVEPPLELKVPR